MNFCDLRLKWPSQGQRAWDLQGIYALAVGGDLNKGSVVAEKFEAIVKLDVLKALSMDQKIQRHKCKCRAVDHQHHRR